MMRKITAALAGLILMLQLGGLSVFAETVPADSGRVPALDSEAAVLMDQTTGKVLAEKDSHKKMYPASITKVLTALLTVENLDLNGVYTVGKEINLTQADSSDSGLRSGDKITGHDLIWAMMLPSGNDAAYAAAVAVARKVSGDPSMKAQDAVKSFTELMNKRARELGANESSFTNPDGYPDKNHYSTANDMALISREAMKNEFMRQVVGTYTYDINHEGTETTSGSVKNSSGWVNINQLINKNSKYYYEYANGIKTGHTSSAGYCLAASATKGDVSLISIILKAGSEAVRWEEAKALFEYGFNNFKYHTLMKKGTALGKVTVVRKYLNDEIQLNAMASKDFSDIFSDSDFNNIKSDIEWDPKLLAGQSGTGKEPRLIGPVKSGQVLGRISYSLDGKVIAEAQLTADKDSVKGNFTDTVYLLLDKSIRHIYLVIGALAVLLAGVLVLVRVRAGRKRTAQI